VLVPPDGYLQGIRDLCDRYGILMIADEIMSGFGRTGAWFAVDHWGVVPDLITMAKGLTSAYIQLGAVGMRRWIAESFDRRVYHGGLTYNSHPLACAAALATISVYEEERLVERSARMGERLRQKHQELSDRHEIVGTTRSIGLFGAVELVRSRETMEPLAPFNATSSEMQRLAHLFREKGLYTFVRWNFFHTNPPLTVTEEELDLGFRIIDEALAELSVGPDH
jgi:taurine--2-oxoglutarate transaminase